MSKWWNKLKASFEKRLRKWLGVTEEPKVEWQEGSHTIDCDALGDWTFDLDCTGQDMTRANGEPERVWILFDFEGIEYKVYAMVDNRDGIRVRSKGLLEIHIRDSVHSPVPKGDFKLSACVLAGVLKLTIDGAACKKGCGSVGDAKLKQIVISPDAGRPAGFKWSNPVFVQK